MVLLLVGTDFLFLYVYRVPGLGRIRCGGETAKLEIDAGIKRMGCAIYPHRNRSTFRSSLVNEPSLSVLLAGPVPRAPILRFVLRVLVGKK